MIVKGAIDLFCTHNSVPNVSVKLKLYTLLHYDRANVTLNNMMFVSKHMMQFGNLCLGKLSSLNGLCIFTEPCAETNHTTSLFPDAIKKTYIQSNLS